MVLIESGLSSTFLKKKRQKSLFRRWLPLSVGWSWLTFVLKGIRLGASMKLCCSTLFPMRFSDAMNLLLVLGSFWFVWAQNKADFCMYPIAQWRVFNCSVKRKQQELRRRLLFSIQALAKQRVHNGYNSSLAWDSLIQVCPNRELREKYQICVFLKSADFCVPDGRTDTSKFFSPQCQKSCPSGGYPPP